MGRRYGVSTNLTFSPKICSNTTIVYTDAISQMQVLFRRCVSYKLTNFHSIRRRQFLPCILHPLRRLLISFMIHCGKDRILKICDLSIEAMDGLPSIMKVLLLNGLHDRETSWTNLSGCDDGELIVRRLDAKSIVKAEIKALDQGSEEVDDNV